MDEYAKGLLIEPDGTMSFVLIDNFIDIQAAVGGDFDWTSPSSVIYYCYEWSLFEQPRNPLASLLYHETHPGVSDPLAGTVLVLGPADSSGNDTHVPDAFVQRAHAIYEEKGADWIKAQSKPLSVEAIEELKQRQARAENQMRDALSKGIAVDLGSLSILPPQS